MEFCVVWKQVLLTSQEADFMVERIMSFPVEQVWLPPVEVFH